MASTTKGLVLDAPLLIAAIAIILFRLAQPIDSWLAQSIAILLGLSPAVAGGGPGIIPQLANIALFFIYSASGFACARFLRSAARFIVVPQLLALTAVIVFPIYHSLVPGLEPFSYVCAGLIGFAFGSLSSKLNDTEEKLYTQQVESTLRNRELLETRLQLIKQDEIERKMLAADLHDQVLNDMKLLLRLLEQKKERLDALLVQELRSRIEIAIEGIRKVMESLCPSDLEHIGLLAALEECLKERAEKSGFLPQFRSNVQEETIQSLNKIEKALLYRLVQESLTNICKHASASCVRLSVELQEGELTIKVLDDGVGIRTEETTGKSRGLQYMKLRAELVGARINWSSGPENKGTLVEIKVNLAGRPAAEGSDR